MDTSQQPQERQECLRKIQSLTEDLRKWREEATMVKVEGTTSREEDN